MKVFIVTDGTRFDYHIEAVFSNKEKAEAYCALHGYDDIVAYEVDAAKVDESVKVFHNYVFTSFLGKIELVDVRFTTKNQAKIKKTCHSFDVEIPMKEENEPKACYIAEKLYERYKFLPEEMDLELMVEE